MAKLIHMIQKRAFTLIELLVVVSIIALLVGILLPALSAAREAAQDSQCKANMRSGGQAMVMYVTEDVSGYIPENSIAVRWDKALNRFLNADRKAGFGGDYMRCPSIQPDAIRTFGANYNNTNLWAGAPINEIRSMRLDNIDPRTFIYADAWNRVWGALEAPANGTPNATWTATSGHTLYDQQGWVPTIDWDGDGITDSSVTQPSGPYGGFGVVHFDSGNMVFSDGHVDGITLNEYLTNRNADGLWNTK